MPSFTDVVSQAARAFGSAQRADEWLRKPAIGLDGERPFETMRTDEGVQLVSDSLTRLENNVYI